MSEELNGPEPILDHAVSREYFVQDLRRSNLSRKPESPFKSVSKSQVRLAQQKRVHVKFLGRLVGK